MDSLYDTESPQPPAAGPIAVSEEVLKASTAASAQLFSSRLPVSERHVQAIWYDPSLRPAAIETQDGRSVRVIDPGAWNVESGPDFRDATLEIDGRRVRGDVEIHLRPHDWTAHGHAADKAYAKVAAHVTWMPGPRPEGLPPDAVSIALESAVCANPTFSPSSIDLAAYPYAHIPATPRPCARILMRDPDLAVAVLRAAGIRRIGIKAARMSRLLQTAGSADQVLWEEMLGALGYKSNEASFRELARILPIEEMPRDRDEALAALLGAARILPDFDRTQDGEAADFARRLAETWFKNPRERLPPDMRPRAAGARPANSPLRRLAAAAALAAAPGGLPRLRGGADPAGLRGFVRTLCEAARWPFFESRWGFSSKRAGERDRPGPPALIGQARAAALAANVSVPFAIAEGRLPGVPEWLPPEDLSQPMRQTAHRLLGRDHNAALYSSNGLLMQGLLQTRRDFCLSVHPDCKACPLAAALARDAAERKK